MQKNNYKKLCCSFVFLLISLNFGCSSGSNCTIAGRGTGSNCDVSSAPVSEGEPASPGILPAPVLTLPLGPSDFKVCSNLDFANVNFPAGFTATDTQAFKAALSISGSYEGDTGWVNLTNNFDGQGLSMGLLNQCLGQGSLQPLLSQMVAQHAAELGQIFDGAKLQSLVGMLTAWQKARSNTLVSLEEKMLSQFDIGPASGTVHDESTASSTSASVQWALANLYRDNGVTFDPTWAAQLTALGQSRDYIAIQLQEAAYIHSAALNYLNLINIHELRTYLLMFDFNVQNGGIYNQDWTDLAKYVAQNPDSSDTDRLREILTLRLRHVKSQYVSDVQSRKAAIIDGMGVVHGKSRNLPQQYCYPQNAAYR